MKIVTPHGAGHPENTVAVDDESSALTKTNFVCFSDDLSSEKLFF